MTLRAGIIGCGFIGLVHGVALRALVEGGVVDAEVAAVCDTERGRAERVARAVRGPVAVVDDAAALLDRCDAVWVCTPTSTHLGLVRAAAEVGRAVFCEKPVGRSHAEAAAVTEAAVAAGVPHQVGLVLRAAPVFRTLREQLHAGRFGRFMNVLFRDDQFLPVQGRYRSTWRKDVATAGGGALIEHSVHDLDLLAWLAGPVARLSAHTASFAGHPGIEDLATVLLEYAGGGSATLTSVWHQVLSRPSTRRVEVFCEDAVVWLDDDSTGPLHVQTSDGVTEVACPHPDWVQELPFDDEGVRRAIGAYVAADRGFLDAVLAGRAPEPGLDEALTAHRLVDAAYRAARERTQIAPVDG